MTKPNNSKTAIQRAVDAAGGQSALARSVGVTPQAVQQWVSAGRVSYRKALEVASVTGIPLNQLRPDIFQSAPPN